MCVHCDSGEMEQGHLLPSRPEYNFYVLKKRFLASSRCEYDVNYPLKKYQCIVCNMY